MNESPRIAELVSAVTQTLSQRARPLAATYRLQFQHTFTFADATARVEYLHDLGISHVYASPYLKARAKSAHGYDVCDHGLLNPELGSADDYANWVAALKRHQMGHILDVVPNHMAIATNDWLVERCAGKWSQFALRSLFRYRMETRQE